MEEIYEKLDLREDDRKDLRKLLVGITPSSLAQIGRYASIQKLKKLQVPDILALAIAYASVVSEKSKLS